MEEVEVYLSRKLFAQPEPFKVEKMCLRISHGIYKGENDSGAHFAQEKTPKNNQR